MSFSESIDSLVANVQDNLPDILSGISLTAGVGSVIYGIVATPKAIDIILEYVMENTTPDDRRGMKTSELYQLIPFWTRVKLLWKLYLPVLMGTATFVGTGIASDVMHDRKELAYAALATAAETRLNDFMQSTKELVGPKKYEEIETATDKKVIDRLPEPVKDENVYYVNRKTEGFPVVDNFTMRVYVTDRNELDRIESKLNNKLVMEDVSLNDVYRAFSEDIPLIKGGENLVYTAAHGKFTFVEDMTGQLWEGRPAGVINLLHNLCIRPARDEYIKIDPYA